MRDVRQERTGWRDLSLSLRHREWGWNVPGVDLDWLFLEYDRGQPTAIIEYKHERASAQRAGHPNYQAMINLGNRAKVPVFACRYASDFSWWCPVALNDLARKWLPDRPMWTEAEWVEFLYKLRGYTPPPDLIEALKVRV